MQRRSYTTTNSEYSCIKEEDKQKSLWSKAEYDQMDRVNLTWWILILIIVKQSTV